MGARARRLALWILLPATILASADAALAQGGRQADPISRGTSFGTQGLEVLEDGRFRVAAFPEDLALARSLLRMAVAQDTFPGLPTLSARVVIEIAPDEERFRQWVGPRVPEWGAAVAFPSRGRIVVRGQRAGGRSAGDPAVTLRHELAHLALREHLGFPAPRWFDEGYASYAAGEVGRGNVLATNLALVWNSLPTLDSLSHWFLGGADRAQAAYALAHLAVEDHARRDPERGLTLFFEYWKGSGSYERALRQAYGVTSVTVSDDWQRRVKLRYGALGVLSDAAVSGLIMLALIGPVWVLRRRRDRRRMQALRDADLAYERWQRERELTLRDSDGGVRLVLLPTVGRVPEDPPPAA